MHADEYGRSHLDDTLKRSIPDNNSEPDDNTL